MSDFVRNVFGGAVTTFTDGEEDFGFGKFVGVGFGACVKDALWTYYFIRYDDDVYK